MTGELRLKKGAGVSIERIVRDLSLKGVNLKTPALIVSCFFVPDFDFLLFRSGTN